MWMTESGRRRLPGRLWISDTVASALPKIQRMAVKKTQEWLDDGHTPAQLRAELASGGLVRLRRGVVMDADEPGPLELHRRRLIAARGVVGPSTYFSHTSAAVIHGLPLLTRRLSEVIAVRTGGGHGSINPTLHARRASLATEDVSEVDGLPVTSLARTVADLVRALPFPEAVVVADAGLAKGLDRGELLERTAKGRGCRMAARALLFADPRSESAGESLSRVRIHQLGLPAPDLQHSLYDARGRFLGRTDFWWEEFSLAGEFDGRTKYADRLKPGQSPADAIMDEKFRERGIFGAGTFVVRWYWADLWKPGLDVLIRQAMAWRSH